MEAFANWITSNGGLAAINVPNSKQMMTSRRLENNVRREPRDFWKVTSKSLLRFHGHEAQ